MSADVDEGWRGGANAACLMSSYCLGEAGETDGRVRQEDCRDTRVWGRAWGRGRPAEGREKETGGAVIFAFKETITKGHNFMFLASRKQRQCSPFVSPSLFSPSLPSNPPLLHTITSLTPPKHSVPSSLPMGDAQLPSRCLIVYAPSCSRQLS